MSEKHSRAKSMFLGNNEILEQAKELEKQQIIDANNRGFHVARRNIAERADEYYNEKFKKQ